MLYRVTVGPLADAEAGVEAAYGLGTRYPSPWFSVRDAGTLIEADKEFRQGFETFIAPGLAYGHWRKDTPKAAVCQLYEG